MTLHFFHHRSRLLTVAAIIIIILGALAIYQRVIITALSKELHEMRSKSATAVPAAAPETPVTTPAETTKSLANFSNATYNFSLAYPKQYQIKEYNSTTATIGYITGSGDLENIDGKTNVIVVPAKSTADSSSKLQDFIFKNVKLLCDADGGGVSLSCPRQKSLTPMKLASGLPGYVLTLEQEEKTIGPEASITKTEAVFFITDISTNNKRAILVTYPVGDGGIELARQVAETIKR